MDITHGGAWCSLRPACGIRYEQVAAGGRLDSRNARPNQGRYAGDAQGSSLALCAGGLKTALGRQFRKSTPATVRSASAPRTDIVRPLSHVRKVPTTDSCTAANSRFPLLGV